MHSYNIHRCIIKLYPGHFLKCQLQVDLFCFNCLGCRFYTYIDHSSKIHTVYLTYASFFQMEDSQIPSTTFIGFSAPDDIVPNGSTLYRCHIAMPLTRSVRLKQSQWLSRQCDTLSMQQLIYTCRWYCWSIEYSSWPWVYEVVVAVLHAFFDWTWQSRQCGWSLRMSQCHCRHLQIILSATVRRKTLKRMMQNMS